MSSVKAIRAAVLASMRAVPDMGMVHAFERYTRDEARFRELYLFAPAQGEEQLRGWWLRRVSTQETTVSTGTVMNVHTWQWRGYMALKDDDESELVFDDLIEAYRDAVRADPTFGDVCEQNAVADGDDGVQVMSSGPVTFCGVLCHSAVLQLRTWSYL
jgi:hypothetical protein